MLIRAVHPGVFLKEELDSLLMSVREFSKRTGISEKQLSLLLSGSANLTLDMAEKLSKFFGNSIAFWVNLQTLYEQEKKALFEQEEIEKDYALLKKIDTSWLHYVLPEYDAKDKEKAVSLARVAFQTSSLQNLSQAKFYPIYKELRSKNEGDVFLQNVWLSVAIKKAKEYDALVYDKSAFRLALEGIKPLTKLEPAVFYPILVDRFKKAGVCFMVLPHLKNTNVFGASLWVEKDGSKYPLIILSNRGHSADVFWFSLCHEAAHVLMEHTKNLMINSLDTRSNPIEDEADIVGKAMLIASDDWMRFHPSPGQRHTSESVNKFAKRMGLDPCIVVGWIQHDCPETKYMYKSMKKTYDFIGIV